MPQPTATDVHVDKILTNVAVAYMQAATSFIATRVFPIVPVRRQSDKYYIFDKNAWFRDDMQRRSPGQESAGSGYTLSTTTYACDVWALHKDIDNQTRANTDAPLDPERNASRWLIQQALQRLERQWVTDYFAAAIWGTDKTGGTDFTRWSDYTTSDPIEDIEAGKEVVLKNTGFEPNTLVVGYQTFRQLKNHPDIVDRVKYTSSQTVTADMLARIFEVDRVLVAKAVKATNVENETTVYDFTHGKHALLCYAAPQPGLEVPSAGYNFMWEDISAGLGENIAISRIDAPLRKSVRIEIEAAWDNKVVGTDLGYFFSGAVV